MRCHATWYDYQICVWFRNSDFSLSLFSDPLKHLKLAFLFSLEKHPSFVPDLSLLFDHEPFCHLTFLITFKYNYTGNFFFFPQNILSLQNNIWSQFIPISQNLKASQLFCFSCFLLFTRTDSDPFTETNSAGLFVLPI